MSEEFKEWAIIELMGHQRIAGRVSEQQIGGSAFVRVDVPTLDDKNPGFTKLFGPSAIYAITITDEQTATMAAKSWQIEAMDRWTVKNMLQLQGADEEEGLF